MSLILEALRKSEAERRRGQPPDLRVESPPTPAHRPTRLPSWIWSIPAAAGLLIMTLWLARAPERPHSVTGAPATPAAATTTHPTTSVTTTSADRGRSMPAPLPPVPRLLPAAAADPGLASSPSPAPMRPANPPLPVATTAPTVSAPPAPVAAPDLSAPPMSSLQPTGSEVLQLSDLSAAERKSLPPLKLSMHLWNNDPARRFVILDGNRVVEGDRLGDAVVTAITRDGVWLDWNGRRLKLPIR